MLRFNVKQRENTGRALLNMLTVSLATLVFNTKGSLSQVLLGCIIVSVSYLAMLWVDR